MIAKIDFERLAVALEDFGDAYLITTDQLGHPRARMVETRLAGTCLHVAGWGRRSHTNFLHQSTVALVYPPREAGGYSLMIDGEAKLRDDDLTVEPATAVLHRPGEPTGPGDSPCGQDCQRLEYA